MEFFLISTNILNLSKCKIFASKQAVGPGVLIKIQYYCTVWLIHTLYLHIIHCITVPVMSIPPMESLVTRIENFDHLNMILPFKES